MEETKKPLTRAEKKDATKEIIKGLLQKNGYKASELIDEASKAFTARFAGEETDNVNDVRGRIGSVLDVMKKENEIVFENGAYAKLETQENQEKPKKRTRAKKTEKAEKAEKTETVESVETQSQAQETEKPKKSRAKKKIEPLPPAPLQPIAPTAPTSPETAPEPVKQEKPKKRTRAKAEKTENVEKIETAEIKEEIKQEEKPEKHEIMDISFLLGGAKKGEKTQETKDEKPAPVQNAQPTQETKPAPVQPVKEPKPQEKTEKKPAQAKAQPKAQPRVASKEKPQKPKTADEKLQDAFLSRLHRLGGEYFEYYCVYLLEKYSKMNGRRLESLKINGGDHDGGIDGEIEVTDRLGFRETIYIQAKNWDPSKGDEKLWVVGETLLQQFIGACVCRQAKDKKQHCRGMFITTSRFTPEAKRLLQDTSEKFVGYDGADLYETAKECGFGIVKRGGEYVIDENLLSSTKAFFHMN